MCGVTGFPPPHSITWALAWEGQQPEEQQQKLSSPQRGHHHHLDLAYSLNMSAYSSSSRVEVTCSACNSLGCGRSPSLPLYIVGKTSITAPG